jgi:hypothetical protein
MSETTTDGVVNLEKVISEPVDPLPGELRQTSAILPLKVHPSSELLDDPTTRVYMYIDFRSDYRPFSSQFSSFLYRIKSGSQHSDLCNLQLADPRPLGDENTGDVFFNAPFIDGTVYDMTRPANPDGTRDPLLIAPEGMGGGEQVDDFGLGINVFDLTDVQPGLCNGTVRELISDDPSQLYNIEYVLANPGSVVLRDMKIYLGHQGSDNA